MKITNSSDDTSNHSNGFTLVEVMIAIFIGLIVMGMAVAILTVTSSTSLRVLAKSEAQQTTRGSLVKILDTVANAESLDICKVGKDKKAQESIQLSTYHPSIAESDCMEVAPSGFVIAWAHPNRMCFYDKKATGDPAVVHCLTRGGDDAAQPLKSIPLEHPISKTHFGGCVNHTITGSSENALYYFTCKPSGGTQIRWSDSYEYTNSGPEFMLADLGISVLATTTTTAPYALPNIFEYSLDSDPTSALTKLLPVERNVEIVDHKDLDKIVSLKIDISVRYDTKRSKKVDIYKFSQDILLRGSNKALEESYNGQ